MRGRADGCRGRRWWRRGVAPAPAACDTAALAEAKSRAPAREAEAAALARLRSFELLHQALRDVVNLRAAAGAQRDRAAGRRTAVFADRLAAAILAQLERGLRRR